MKTRFLLSGCFALALVACGDETNVTKVTNETIGMEVAVSADSLGACDSAVIGKTVFASSESSVYICADSGWVPLSKAAASGKDGADGENGTDGKDGTDGASCTVKALPDSSGYKVVCGGDSVGVILNGSDGKDGKNNEEGCSLAEDRDGTVKFVCGKADTVTLYKALCGSESYDPAKRFCFADSAYDLCGSKSYDPAKEFCASDSAYALCGGTPYDPLETFCFTDSVYALCNAASYDPTTKFCLGNTVYDRCGGKTYDPTDSVWKCYDGKIAMRFTDDRDGKSYLAVKIGEQIWMAENLNYDSTGYCYNDNTSNCKTYGRHYMWNVAQKVCPVGFHLPSLAEWETLDSSVAYILYEGKTDSVGYALKSTNGWKDYNGKSGNGSDVFGFSGLAAGCRLISGSFSYIDEHADFWSTTSAKLRHLYYSETSLRQDTYPASAAYSVRCVKD